MGTFIDTLGRLTDEQSQIIAKNAQKREFEQQQLAIEEMDRLHEEDVLKARELELLEAKMAERRETLSMAWLGAELLKAAGVKKQDWINASPEIQTKGLIRRRREIVGREERFAFDAWELESMTSKSNVYSDFYSSEQTQLVLADDGEIGVASVKRYQFDSPRDYIEFRLEQRRQSVRIYKQTSLSGAKAKRAEDEYLASDTLCQESTLELLPHDGSSNLEPLVRGFYFERHWKESNKSAQAIYDRFYIPRFSSKLGDLLADKLIEKEDRASEKAFNTIGLDGHLRISVANLLAVNGIKIL